MSVCIGAIVLSDLGMVVALAPCASTTNTPFNLIHTPHRATLFTIHHVGLAMDLSMSDDS